MVFAPQGGVAGILTTANTWLAGQNFNAALQVNASGQATILGTFSSKSVYGNIKSVVTGISPYTVAANDEILLVTTGAGGITINLPTASPASPPNSLGRKIIIVKVDSGVGTVTINPNGTDTIEGAASKTLTNQYDKIGLVSDGTSKWYDLGTGAGI